MSSASSSTTSSSPAPSSSSDSNVTGIAVGVSIAVVVLLAIGLFIFWFLRRRRLRVVATQPRHSVRRNTLLDPSHPACHVTPFGAPGSDTPRFVHEPGANMRVAHRRSDGGWEFSEMTPDNWSTFDLAPPASRLSLSARSTLSCASTSKEKLKLRPGDLTTRGFVEGDADVVDNPPPAYCDTNLHSVGGSQV